MPKTSKPPVSRTGKLPLRVTRAPKKPRFDPRDLGGNQSKGRPLGGRPPRFPGRTGGR